MRLPWSKKKARYVVREVTTEAGGMPRSAVVLDKLTYDNHTFRSGDVVEVKGHFGPRVRVRNGDPVEVER